ncbi:MAG: hypothetical protein HY209_00460 [Candidatus Omnitrophica bacterium]|nr:hypothetical protein [Candidatus Omnitrophota bacterium]
MGKKQLTTPVLFSIFRRPDITQSVFNEIRKARPQQLFVRADGPHPHVKGEAELCMQTRAIIQQVDWDCQVYKNYSDINLGCRVALSSAIHWFFSQVESGIVLEDDCLPSQSFFWFCQELLEHYKQDERIMQISGANYMPQVKIGTGTYYFSKFNDVSGWATWKRAWKFYDMNMSQYSEFKKQRRIYDYLDNKEQAAWLMSYFEEAVELDKCGVWSTQWTFAMAKNNGLTICPNMPLTIHMGFNEDGTNFQKSASLYPKVQLQDIDHIIHPSIILPSREADALKFELIRKTDPHVSLEYRWRKAFKAYLKEHCDPQTYERIVKFRRRFLRQA